MNEKNPLEGLKMTVKPKHINRGKAIVIDRPDFSPALRCKGIVHNMPICPLPWDIFGVIK